MLLAYYILSLVLILVHILPSINHQHWIFRIWEFGRIQIMILQLLLLALGPLFSAEDRTIFFMGTVVLQSLLLIHNVVILIPYTIAYKKNQTKKKPKNADLISILSINVYQFNNQYEELIKLVREVTPDILLTIETNQDWDNALCKIEDEYPNFKKVPLENTYGIHCYTKLRAVSLKTNYFIEKDIPSIEASLISPNGIPFTLFGVHPPPPSPTEETNSKERDGELLSLAKKVRITKGPVIVVGDFNAVAWSKPSLLFRKKSRLIDPRIGRGFISTYHAKYKLLRFPIDLVFHSSTIYTVELKALSNIGSDHLPLFCQFFIDQGDPQRFEEENQLDKAEEIKIEQLIEDGITQKSDRPKIAIEEK